MGFFSSRKVEGEGYSDGDKSVVHVIRSRFYGKNKGKEREDLSQPTEKHKGNYSQEAYATRRDVFPKHATQAPFIDTTSRSPIDAITLALTQRLNELAVAHSEGLLDDEEYRLLRQDLFERFARGSAVPTEIPVVPSGPPFKKLDIGSVVSPPSPINSTHKLKSNSSRPPSVRSKSSVTSAVSNLFRRSMSRRSPSMSTFDSSSIFSLGSANSNILPPRSHPRAIARKGSDSSMRTETSRGLFDTISVSSRRTGQGPEGIVEMRPLPSLSRSTTRSTKRLASPPSSFPTRVAGAGAKHILSTSISDLFNDDNLKTVKDIRHHIEAVEAEGRSLIDAFNGLELSTMTRRQQSHIPPPSSPLGIDLAVKHVDNWSYSMLPPSPRLLQKKDNDTMSTQSGAPAAAPSWTLSISGASLISQSAPRKKSVSSVSSRTRLGVAASSSLPRALGHLGSGSTSSVNLGSPDDHSPLDPVSDVTARSDSHAEDEMVDVRRRRLEVIGRYEARLEYLRARLKSAELHEKLLRK